MLLTNPIDIIQALGFDQMVDITNAATMALDASEAQLASILNTDFAQATNTDTFFVRQPPYMDGPACETEFRLKQAFVTALTSVRCAPTVAGFSDSTQYTDVTANVICDNDRGVVQDFETRYNRQWVQITYTAGFPPDTTLSPPTSYLMTSVPDWLQQAARLNALIGMADSPVLSEAQIKLDVATLKVQYTALISRKTRYAPLAILPF